MQLDDKKRKTLKYLWQQWTTMEKDWQTLNVAIDTKLKKINNVIPLSKLGSLGTEVTDYGTAPATTAGQSHS
jgi:hypothetical protein